MRVRLEVPATSANLGPGYDSYGLALDIVDTLTLTVQSPRGINLAALVDVPGGIASWPASAPNSLIIDAAAYAAA